jgi:hypothetical protein
VRVHLQLGVDLPAQIRRRMIDWERWPRELAGDSSVIAKAMERWREEYLANVHALRRRPWRWCVCGVVSGVDVDDWVI